ncbi:MAG: TIGR02680 family protein, partial [Microbacteriaceae bacterium]
MTVLHADREAAPDEAPSRDAVPGDAAPGEAVQGTDARVDLPRPTIARWQPLRLGLVDLFYYENEVFPFVDGRLLLRGNNGAGKSKVLALTLPFLFDGDLSPQRVEPDGDRQKQMVWNLLLGGEHPNSERIGYSWLEFGRVDADGTEHFITIGAGLKAARARGITRHWFFITSSRIGDELALVDDGRIVLTRERLADALGDRGRIYDTKAEYRRALDEKLFGLGERRYAELIELLLQIRAPQLSKRPSESALSEALTRALTPVADDVITSVADGLRSLDEDREELARMVDARRAVHAFLGHYRAYARTLLKRRAAGPRSQQAEHDRSGRAIIELNSRVDAQVAALDDAENRLRTIESEQVDREGQQSALRDSEHVQSERQLALADRSVQQAEGSRLGAENRADRARRALEQADGDATTRQEAAARRTEAAYSARIAAETAAADAALVQEHAAVLSDAGVEPIAGKITADRAATTDRIAHRGDSLDRVTDLVRELDDADTRLSAALQHEDAASSRCAEAAARRAEADDAVERAIDEHIAEVETVVGALRELTVPDEDFTAFTEWVRARDSENPVTTALQRNAAELRGELHGTRATLNGEGTALGIQRAALETEIVALENGESVAPAATHTRTGDRGVPLWRAVSFHDGVDDTARAGIEAALEASGLLTAMVTTDAALRHPNSGEVLLRGAEHAPNAGTSLSDVLRVELPEGTDLDASAVQAIVASVALATGDDDPGPVWVAPNGRFRFGPAYGAWTIDAARYIGESARAAARRLRLDAARDELAQLEARSSRLGEEIAELESRLRLIDDEQRSVPRPVVLEQADRAAAIAADAELRANADRDEAKTAREQRSADRDDSAASLAEDARLLDLPVDANELSRLGDALRDYRRAATEFWHAAELLDEAARSARDAAVRSHAARLASAAADDDRAAAASEAQRHRAYADALRAQFGAAVEEYRAEVQRVEDALKSLAKQHKAASTARQDADREHAVLVERRAAMQSEQERVASARAQAVDALRRTTMLDIARAAVPDLDAPATDEDWTITRGVQFARAIDAALGEVDSSDARYDRLLSQVHTEFTELQRALGRHGFDAAYLPHEDGAQVVAAFSGRDMPLIDLADTLAGQIEQHERLLNAREREIIQNHLVTEVGAQLSELIGDADKQIARLNDEL